MNVPLLDLKEQNTTLRPEIEAALGRVLDTNGFILGGEVAELEKSPDLCARLNACVLLVEDERGIREVVAEVLGDLGLEVCVAEDGLAGLAIIESGRALNLLIADIGLPGMNGRTLAARARVLYPDLPILLMTGYAENASLANGFLGPGMNMITKPFPLSALIEKVQAILHPE